MPKPLIILEQHFGSGATNFIAQNIAELKSLGYSKFLWEMNHDLSLQQVKQEMQMLVSLYGPETMYHHIGKSNYAMLVALEKHGIACEFIDPETRAQAEVGNAKTLRAYNSGSNAAVTTCIDEITANTKKRDQKIIPKIIQEASDANGGVIYIGGFMHVHLVQELAKRSTDFRFAIFANDKEDEYLLRTQGPDKGIWHNLYDADFRQNFYKTNVCFFNMVYDKSLSFEMIEAACKLTEQRRLRDEELPTVANDFARVMPGYQYAVDGHNVVTASKSYANPKSAVTSFVRANLGMRFFMTQEHNGTTRVDVPGLNLQENRGKF